METIFSLRNGVAHILLNRPQVLNALSPAQLPPLSAQLSAWAADTSVRAVVVQGAGGRAFCAGGDIRAVWEAQARGDLAAARAIFRDEYRLNHRIHTFPKPFVSLLDGLVMGGGAGVAMNGTFRVASERTLFAMPEAAIGFFPDTGATWFLSRCPGRVGLYLGLTGARIGAADCLWAGLATHYVPSADHPALLATLEKGAEPVEAVLARFHRDPGPSALAAQAEGIDSCFGLPTLREIISALIADGNEWAWEAVEPIGDNCPTSLAVIFRQLTTADGLDIAQALRREFRMAWRFVASREFHEGIRAAVVDKDRQPVWQPQTIVEVDPAWVEECFAPLGEDELSFAGE